MAFHANFGKVFTILSKFSTRPNLLRSSPSLYPETSTTSNKFRDQISMTSNKMRHQISMTSNKLRPQKVERQVSMTSNKCEVHRISSWRSTCWSVWGRHKHWHQHQVVHSWIHLDQSKSTSRSFLFPVFDETIKNIIKIWRRKFNWILSTLSVKK